MGGSNSQHTHTDHEFFKQNAIIRQTMMDNNESATSENHVMLRLIIFMTGVELVSSSNDTVLGWPIAMSQQYSFA